MSWVGLLEQSRPRSRWSDMINEAKAAEELPTSVPTEFSANGTSRPPVVNMFNFSAKPNEANSDSNRAASWLKMGAEFASSRLGFLGLAFSSIGKTGMESSDYKRYYTPATLKLVKQGYVLIITEALAGDLNAFGRQYSARKMTGEEITSMAKEFDRLFCPVYTGFFAPLVAIEWPASPKGVFDSRSSQHYSQGGMRGGSGNAYWGITQFGNSRRAPTYDETVAAGRRFGIFLPAQREQMTFGQMLVAAYVLAIVRQPTLVKNGIPVNAETIYINHNQGNGIWLATSRKIPVKNWDQQSAHVHTILKKYGYSRA